jgi:uncharacterized membrane protein
MSYEQAVTTIGSAVEGAGVVVIVIGAIASTVQFLARLRRHGADDRAYRLYRHGLGRSLLLGLEFLVAGDIIRTVTATPSLDQVAVLAIIVLIRTFLSVALEVETEGRWPWQSRQGTADAAPASADE